MIKTVSLNFKLDEPTHNGRIYPISEFRDAMDEALVGTLYLYGYEGQRANPELKSMIGKVMSYVINADNSVSLNISFINNQQHQLNPEIFEKLDFTINAYGDINENKITGLKINHFYVIPKRAH